MSIRSLFSTKLDQLETLIKVSGENFERTANNISEKMKELNSPYNIKREELEHSIKLFERYNEIMEKHKKLFPNFSIEKYISSGKHLKKTDDFLDIEYIYFECISEQRNIENKIKELAENIFGKDIASLDVIDIKEYLYKNW